MINIKKFKEVLDKKGFSSESIKFVIDYIQLEESKDSDEKWEWINDYVDLFKNIGKGQHKKESLLRLKKLFSENPDVRKEEVIGATKLYLLNTNPKYVRFPHYFISKGIGTEKTSDLLTWIEIYRKAAIPTEERDVFRKLQ